MHLKERMGNDGGSWLKTELGEVVTRVVRPSSRSFDAFRSKISLSASNRHLKPLIDNLQEVLFRLQRVEEKWKKKIKQNY
jgi:ribosomal silencing factor RsfS